MQLDNTTLALGSVGQVFNGVELSKDQTGVFAMLSLSDYRATIFFNGYTAQINLIGTEIKKLPPHGITENLVPICALFI